MIGKRITMLKGSEWVFIGIGANLGAPQTMIRGVVKELSEIALGPVSSSSIWRCEASGMTGNDFANAVVKFKYEGDPQDLLEQLQSLEVKHGRASEHEKFTSRTLDLDIIAFGVQRFSNPELDIPHPRANARLFVLLPLQEIEPGFRFAGRSENLELLIEKADPLRIEVWKD
jgi:2-amino-4-hydroxy-6-hydroxymethyldihydropteridine diphosphokinase